MRKVRDIIDGFQKRSNTAFLDLCLGITFIKIYYQTYFVKLILCKMLLFDYNVSVEK